MSALNRLIAFSFFLSKKINKVKTNLVNNLSGKEEFNKKCMLLWLR